MALSKQRVLGKAVFLLGGAMSALRLIALLYSWRTSIVVHAVLSLLFICGLLILLITRHLRLVRLKSRLFVPWQTLARQRGVRRNRTGEYCLFVLGSGGHTKEMLMMMDDGFSNFENFHRRYLISTGDGMSLNHLQDFEEGLRELCQQKGHSPGTYDVMIVKRARRVHQSLLTTPITAAWSFAQIVLVLLRAPRTASGLRFPSLIFSNGPATGFFVALAVHALKILYIIPENKCLFVYIESWARISTLSLTGKLLYYTGIADSFAVQHGPVARRYGLPNAGPLVFNSRRSITADQ